MRSKGLLWRCDIEPWWRRRSYATKDKFSSKDTQNDKYVVETVVENLISLKEKFFQKSRFHNKERELEKMFLEVI